MAMNAEQPRGRRDRARGAATGAWARLRTHAYASALTLAAVAGCGGPADDVSTSPAVTPGDPVSTPAPATGTPAPAATPGASTPAATPAATAGDQPAVSDKPAPATATPEQKPKTEEAPKGA